MISASEDRPRGACEPAECVEALVRAGFRSVGSLEVPAILEREGHAVVVPDLPVIDSDTLGSILNAAGVTNETFWELLAG